MGTLKLLGILLHHTLHGYRLMLWWGRAAAAILLGGRFCGYVTVVPRIISYCIGLTAYSWCHRILPLLIMEHQSHVLKPVGKLKLLHVSLFLSQPARMENKAPAVCV